jgi:DNA-binding NtrC family response regulator
VRIIAASNKSLNESVEKGLFRVDLFYRLNIVEIHLPSLEERKEDVSPLVQHFIMKHSKRMGKLVRGATNDVIRVLMNHKWRGQVRELENIIERALIFADGEYVTINDLPEELKATIGPIKFSESMKLKDRVREFERNYIEQQLVLFNQDKEKTAEILGISVSSLYRKIEELAIEKPK